MKKLGGRKCALNTFHIKHLWWQKCGHRWSVLCYLVRPEGRSKEVRLGRALFQDRRSISFHLDPRPQVACHHALICEHFRKEPSQCKDSSAFPTIGMSATALFKADLHSFGFVQQRHSILTPRRYRVIAAINRSK